MAAGATNEGSALTREDFRFDPTVSGEVASTGTNACAVSAQREAVVVRDEMLVRAAKEVSAGAAGHPRSPIVAQPDRGARVRLWRRVRVAGSYTIAVGYGDWCCRIGAAWRLARAGGRVRLDG